MAGSVDLGSVYATLELRTQDFDKSIQDSTKAVSGMASKLGGSFDNIANSIASVIKPMTVFALTGSVGLGGLVKFGFDATREIQKTTAGIISLTGSAEEAGKVINQMIEYVQGKPFDRLEVIAASRQLLAMGRTTQELTGDIDILGRAVVLTGGDFEALAQIYGQAASSNRIMSGELNQLEANGIPITQKLGIAMGVTAQQVRELAEKGQIDFGAFRNALELALPADIVKNASNTIDNRMKSLSASFRNLAFDILGVDFSKMDGRPLIEVGGFLDKIIDAIEDVIKKLRSPEMRETFRKIGDQLSSIIAGALPKLIDSVIFLMVHLKTILGIMGALIMAWGTMKALAIAAKIVAIGTSAFNSAKYFIQLSKAFGLVRAAWATLSAAFLLNPVGLIVAAIALLIAGLALLQIKFDIFGKSWRWVKEQIEPLLPVLENVRSFIKDQLVSAFDSIKRVWEKLTEAMQPLVDAFKEFWKKHGSKVATVLKYIAIATTAILIAPLVYGFMIFLGTLKVLSTVLKFVADHFDTIKKVIMIVIGTALLPLVVAVGLAILAFKYIPKAVGAVIDWFVSAWQSTYNFFVTIWNNVKNFFVTVWQGIWDTTVTVWQSIYNAVATPINNIWHVVHFILELLKNLFIVVYGSILIVVLTAMNAVWDVIVSVWNAIWGFIQPILQGIWDFIVLTFNSIKDSITLVWNTIFDFVKVVLTKIVDFFKERWDNLKNNTITVFNAVKDFISNVWDTIYGIIKSIVQRIIDFFAPAFTWLLDKGKAIVNGLAEGISNTAGAVWNAIKGVADQIGKFFTGAGSWLYDSGKALFQGFINGMTAIGNKVKDTAEGIVKKVRDLLPFSPAKDGPFSGKGWTLYSGKALMEGFIQGMNSMKGKVSSTMADTLPDISGMRYGINSNMSARQADVLPQSNTVAFYGDVSIANQQDADYLLQRLSRRQDLTVQGLVGV